MGTGTLNHRGLILAGSRKAEEERRRDLCLIGRLIYDRGYVAGTDGNLSLRLDADRILVSPNSLCKGTLEPKDLVIVGLDGRKLSGHREPSSELEMHLTIYRLRPDVSAVCHAHPPAATGFAAAGLPLEEPLLAEMVVALGAVPLAPYGMPGTAALSDTIEPLVGAHDALLLANHGVVTYGPDLRAAFFRMETAEHLARVALVTRILGKQTLLSPEQVRALREAYCGERSHREGKIGPNGSRAARGDERISLSRSELDAIVEAAVAKRLAEDQV